MAIGTLYDEARAVIVCWWQDAEACPKPQTTHLDVETPLPSPQQLNQWGLWILCPEQRKWHLLLGGGLWFVKESGVVCVFPCLVLKRLLGTHRSSKSSEKLRNISFSLTAVRCSVDVTRSCLGYLGRKEQGRDEKLKLFVCCRLSGTKLSNFVCVVLFLFNLVEISLGRCQNTRWQ